METYSIEFHGKLLERGFWLYVIDIRAPKGRYLYVGRTGDSSSAHAASPFSRIGQHLDWRPSAKANALSRNLRLAGIEPTQCAMRMIAIGPLFPEENDFLNHCTIRDQMAALEKALADSLRARGYQIVGRHSAKGEPDRTKLSAILQALQASLSKN